MSVSMQTPRKLVSTPRGICLQSRGAPPKLLPIRIRAMVSVQGLINKFVVIEIKDYKGEQLSIKMPRSDFFRFSKFNHGLREAGFAFPTDAVLTKQLHQMVVNMGPIEQWELVNCVGWHGNHFVLPNSPVRLDNKLLRFEADTPDYHVNYTRRGTLQDWQRLVADNALHSSRLLFAISLAFAAPLMRFANIESGGFHLVGTPSKGRAACLIAASSVVGPGIRSELRKYDALDRALEGLAAGHNDCLLCMDRVEELHPSASSSAAKKSASAMFKLAGGRGYLRSGLWGQKLSERQLCWRLTFLSIGERLLSGSTLEEIEGLEGQAVPLIDLPAINDEELGIYESLPPGFRTADDALEGIARGCGANSGVAFDAFLSKVLVNMATIDEEVQSGMDFFMKQAGVPTDAWGRRFATRFAHVFAAATIAAKFDIVQWSLPQIGNAVKNCYLAARSALPNKQQLISEGLATLRTELSKKEQILDLTRAGHKVTWTEEQANTALAFRRSGLEGAYFLIPESTLLDWLPAPLQADLVLEQLDRNGFLMKTARNLKKVQTPIAGITGKRYYYSIRQALLGTVELEQNGLLEGGCEP